MCIRDRLFRLCERVSRRIGERQSLDRRETAQEGKGRTKENRRFTLRYQMEKQGADTCTEPVSYTHLTAQFRDGIFRIGNEIAADARAGQQAVDQSDILLAARDV